MPVSTDARLKQFKNVGKDGMKLRERRKEIEVELRRQRKDEQMLKRRNVELHGEAVEMIPETNQIEEHSFLSIENILAGLYCTETEVQFQATQAARKILSKEKNPPIKSIIDAGAVPILVQFLSRYDNPELQFEAAWALTNIASGTPKQTRCVVNAGAIPSLVKLLSSDRPNICEQSVWALGNIAGDGPELRDAVIRSSVLKPLINLISAETPAPFLRNITWTLSNLCRNKSPPPPFDIMKKAIPVFSHLIHNNDREIVSDCCWAISYLSDGSNEKIQAIVDSGIVPRLVALLSCNVLNILTPTLRSIGNIVTGNDLQTQVVIEQNALIPIRNLLNHSKNSIQKEAAWTISNIAAGSTIQIQAIIDANILDPIVTLLETGDFKTQKESAWAITNFTSAGTVQQMNSLLQTNVLKPLAKLLHIREPLMLLVVLDAFKNFLTAAQRVGQLDKLQTLIEELGALDSIEELQQHDNWDVYQAAHFIIDNFFSEEEDVSLLPQATASSFGFDANSEQINFNF